MDSPSEPSGGKSPGEPSLSQTSSPATEREVTAISATGVRPSVGASPGASAGVSSSRRCPAVCQGLPRGQRGGLQLTPVSGRLSGPPQGPARGSPAHASVRLSVRASPGATAGVSGSHWCRLQCLFPTNFPSVDPTMTLSTYFQAPLCNTSLLHAHTHPRQSVPGQDGQLLTALEQTWGLLTQRSP